MEHPGFFQRAAPVRLDILAEKLGATLDQGDDRAALIRNVLPLGDAGPGDVSFFENRKYLAQLTATKASACLVAPAFAERVPAGTAALVVQAPYRAFAQALHLFYPDALFSRAADAAAGDPPVHPTAAIEDDVRIEPGAVVGREAQIIVQLRGDQSPPHSTENSYRRAYTALTYRQPSLNVEKRVRTDPGDQLVHLRQVMGAQGGLPIVVGGDTIGAVAVSGSPGGDKDEACAKAGLDKVADQLK
jgi:uncharacterized protein GlcG (DUF336 family)